MATVKFYLSRFIKNDDERGEMRYQSAKELIDDIFSDEPVSTEKPEDEVVGIKGTDNQLEKVVAEETTAETQQETMSDAPDSHQDQEDTKDITDTKTIEDARDNKESQTIKEKGGSGTPLKVVAILSALIAVAAIVAVVINHSSSSNLSDVPEPPKVEDSKVNVPIKQICQLSTGEKYVYEGETDTLGIPNGKGKATFDDRVYIGSFENGDMNGYGELTFTSGTKEGRVYKAIFVDNRVNDTCTVVSGPNVFKGTLNDNMDYDCGIQTNSEDGKTYLIKNGDYRLK